MNAKPLVPALIVLALAACSSAPKKPAAASSAVAGMKVQGKGPAHVATGCPSTSPYAAAQEDLSTRGNYTAGGLYAPGVKDTTPDYVPNVACIPEPLVSNEPRSPIGNQSPYQVLGKTYKVMNDVAGYVEKGTASYYGGKFHGRLTSNREVYDMYAFTAAHKTLPLPSFALVTNLDNGESVVVRVNDRGPFHDDRVVDLSYAAAVKLGITQRGTGRVEVRALTEADNAGLLARRRMQGGGTVVASAAAASTVAPAPAAASDIDRLVQRLPARSVAAAPATTAVARAATPAATAAPAASAPAAGATAPGERWRYRVADSKDPGNADNFDAWMKSQGVRVATGKPAAVAATPAATVAAAPARQSRRSARAAAAEPQPQAAAPAPVAVAQVAAAPAPAPQPAAAASPTMMQSALGNILLQVASFASRENANRALSQLASAGIPGASLSDIASGGRTMWRLRVPAPDHASAAELASRIAGLGFGRPQIVKD
ncbi:septal ring lytic transglycosylase RlpA family protein [Stenotrophomonas sp. MMGLT7]|uniref:septal ring lytic transglycosylase RlpA family protein n=1 Tax=Stenotrophomonas sp. MMGLT7 TaxID=2901227 RepID=UPI001E3A1273|nr:septal ring lytic transglycosylase RlpA family protein [Stenotrophomonas sp. MMGLT7]MCD7098308.1 septal ring lytic transglycosylase RlpA family protein [Stenotrophomonas sp. MMGLT7]